MTVAVRSVVDHPASPSPVVIGTLPDPELEERATVAVKALWRKETPTALNAYLSLHSWREWRDQRVRDPKDDVRNKWITRYRAEVVAFVGALP